MAPSTKRVIDGMLLRPPYTLRDGFQDPSSLLGLPHLQGWYAARFSK